MILRQSPSGKPFVGNVNDVLTCQGGDDWAAAPGSGAAAIPWSFTKIIDRLASPGGDGSVGSPYQTIQEAIDYAVAHSLGGVTCFVVSPPNLPDVIAVATDSFFLSISGFGIIPIGDILVTHPNCAIVLENISCGNVTLGLTNSFNAFNSQIGGTFVGGDGSSIFGVETAFADILAPNCAMSATNCALNGETVHLSSLSMQGGAYNGSDTVLADFTINNCTFTGSTFKSTGAASFMNVQIESTVAFDNANAVPFNLDGNTNYWFKSNTCTLTHATKVITTDLTP